MIPYDMQAPVAVRCFGTNCYTLPLPFFWSVCLFVTLRNYEVCDNGNDIKQCNFQNNYGTVASRNVSSCAPIFMFLYGALDFFLGANLYQKLQFLAILAAVRSHF